MHPLDDPVWTALTTLQAKLALINGPARRFPPEVSPHGAFDRLSPGAWEALAQIAREPVSLLSLLPLEMPTGWHLVRHVELYEMVQEKETRPQLSGAIQLVELTADDLQQMSVLYEATRPGRSLAPRLHELGQVVGVKQGGRVLAMGCLRLHLPGYREISTVTTLPGYNGLGYATEVVIELSGRIHASGDVPFLTVRTDNARAISIYRRLGFRERVQMHSTTLRYQPERENRN